MRLGNPKYLHGIRTILILFLLVISNILVSQISPGKLSKPHSNLEGMSNCTQCHNIGDKISEEKCLNCNKDLKARIDAHKGYHSSAQVKQKSCISCHSEHHGVKFELVRFDKNQFDHKLTGYELKGSHQIKDCKSCHKPQNIQKPSLKTNEGTFLGLEQKCVTCHEDYHQKALSMDCAKCHTFEKFKPASNFIHQITDFPLKGAHQHIDCALCHKKEIVGNKTIQRFSQLEFKSCASCHKDEHHGKYGTNCKACHLEETFHKIKPSPNFNHTLTGFELEGKHKSIDCKKCHDNRPGTTAIFKEFNHKNPKECLTCHEDVHESKFGTDCKKCHNQESFRIKRDLAEFNHSLTTFALEGKHQSVECKKCHKTGMMTDPVPHDACNQCHSDYHKGEFKDKPEFKDCAGCHSVKGFNETSFGFDQHQSSNFALKGAHLATECSSCHKKGKNWQFRNIGKECQDCHQDKHKDILDRKFYEPNQCATCHSDESWASVIFDHSKTNFPLEGKHSATACYKCHFQKRENDQIIDFQQFKGTPDQCFRCHENPHGDQFEVSGVTDCKRCHSMNAWDDENHNHDNTRFPLKGEHKGLTCNRCHEPVLINGKMIVLYRNNKLECKDCHK